MDPSTSGTRRTPRRIEQMLELLTAGPSRPTTVNLVIAHLLVDGARVGTGERPLHLGQIYGVNPQQLPSNVAVHRPRPPAPAAGDRWPRAKTLYSGSLLELDFGEEEQEKRVVDRRRAAADARRRSSSCRSPRAAACATCRARSPELGRLAGERGRRLPARARCRSTAPLPGLAERVKELLPNALDVTRRLPARARAARSRPPPARAACSSPRPLFADFYERTHTARRRRRSCSSSSTQLRRRGARGEAAHAHARRASPPSARSSSSTSSASTSSRSPARPAPASRR